MIVLIVCGKILPEAYIHHLVLFCLSILYVLCIGHRKCLHVSCLWLPPQKLLCYWRLIILVPFLYKFLLLNFIFYFFISSCFFLFGFLFFFSLSSDFGLSSFYPPLIFLPFRDFTSSYYSKRNERK